MLRIIIFAASVAVVFGGRSPHADFVEETYGNNPDIDADILEDALLDVPGLVTKYGYPIESHEVVTPDNYILTMHRIPHGRDRNNQRDPNKPIVFLMHGLLSSSADYLILGPSNALGYYLADEGYDVWMGNARGNFYSRRHRTLNPDTSNQFWRFSWEEIGNIDIKAFVDYILALTGQTKLHYIGHSQGGTVFLVLNSLRPEYNEKFISFQGLAPASYFSYNEHPTFTNLATMEAVIEVAAFAMNRGEVFGNHDFINWFTDTLCTPGSSFEELCNSVEVSGRSDYYNETVVPKILGHSPAGASIRQFTHFGQGIRFNSFSRYNYNSRLTNLAVYGSPEPPSFNLNRITAPAYLHYATKDTLVHPQDVELLATRLGNLQGKFLVPSETFDHLDFIWGSGVRGRLYEKVLGLMREAEAKL